MNQEDELKLRFETFVWYEHNVAGDDLERLKRGNLYMFDNKTGVKATSEMIIKMQKHMYKVLPPPSHEKHDHQFNRMNNIIKDCKTILNRHRK